MLSSLQTAADRHPQAPTVSAYSRAAQSASQKSLARCSLHLQRKCASLRAELLIMTAATKNVVEVHL